MSDVLTVCDAVLRSSWLLPLLVVMIAVDAPFPVLPSETILMSAATTAFGGGDVGMVFGLFIAALAGSVLGDAVVFWLGRCSHKLLARTVDTECEIAAWVRRHMLRRPGIALVGARFVPGGRLVSTAAAGRFGLPVRRFLPWSIASSAAWSAYMLLIGLALGPVTGGDPLLSLFAGVAMALATAVGFAAVSKLRRSRVPVAS
ncbi:membrane protein DedA with SNARE-associated domain [Pseudonocardia hierapolitana]|uniref:Membrane protein DedA with SNARE-associated domain n=1 Tax=Pseudonocardia hierapolitana TaxID=1128676 RepID=A0A561SLZ9_9PSEU|nr:VTT domain-containing protein [Pseudonocardia hierapolitana]TWF75889.1 membrane protein DedA with SNARE-associated domain [Pseudonocardia hierapolitana]